MLKFDHPLHHPLNMPIATYLIATTFKITGRGLVLAGCIESGTVTVGDWIVFKALGIQRKRKILAIEGIRKSIPDAVHTGLLIQCLHEIEMEELRNWNPNNAVGSVFAHVEED